MILTFLISFNFLSEMSYAGTAGDFSNSDVKTDFERAFSTSLLSTLMDKSKCGCLVRFFDQFILSKSSSTKSDLVDLHFLFSFVIELCEFFCNSSSFSRLFLKLFSTPVMKDLFISTRIRQLIKANISHFF